MRKFRRETHFDRNLKIKATILWNRFEWILCDIFMVFDTRMNWNDFKNLDHPSFVWTGNIWSNVFRKYSDIKIPQIHATGYKYVQIECSARSDSKPHYSEIINRDQYKNVFLCQINNFRFFSILSSDKIYFIGCKILLLSMKCQSPEWKRFKDFMSPEFENSFYTKSMIWMSVSIQSITHYQWLYSKSMTFMVVVIRTIICFLFRSYKLNHNLTFLDTDKRSTWQFWNGCCNRVISKTNSEYRKRLQWTKATNVALNMTWTLCIDLINSVLYLNKLNRLQIQ